MPSPTPNDHFFSPSLMVELRAFHERNGDFVALQKNNSIQLTRHRFASARFTENIDGRLETFFVIVEHDNSITGRSNQTRRFLLIAEPNGRAQSGEIQYSRVRDTFLPQEADLNPIVFAKTKKLATEIVSSRYPREAGWAEIDSRMGVQDLTALHGDVAMVLGLFGKVPKRIEAPKGSAARIFIDGLVEGQSIAAGRGHAFGLLSSIALGRHANFRWGTWWLGNLREILSGHYSADKVVRGLLLNSDAENVVTLTKSCIYSPFLQREIFRRALLALKQYEPNDRESTTLHAELVRVEVRSPPPGGEAPIGILSLLNFENLPKVRPLVWRQLISALADECGGAEGEKRARYLADLKDNFAAQNWDTSARRNFFELLRAVASHYNPDWPPQSAEILLSKSNRFSDLGEVHRLVELMEVLAWGVRSDASDDLRRTTKARSLLDEYGVILEKGASIHQRMVLAACLKRLIGPSAELANYGITIDYESAVAVDRFGAAIYEAELLRPNSHLFACAKLKAEVEKLLASSDTEKYKMPGAYRLIRNYLLFLHQARNEKIISHDHFASLTSFVVMGLGDKSSLTLLDKVASFCPDPDDPYGVLKFASPGGTLNDWRSDAA